MLRSGNPRKVFYARFSWVDPSGALAKAVAGWFEKDRIKEVPVDSVFNMDDALQVIHSTSPKKMRNVTIDRYQ